jgi:hypothetical protein
MSISDDWDLDYPNKRLSHIDGVLSYDTGTSNQADVGEYIRGSTSGAIGKILSRTGDTTSGTLTLTNVVGQFEENEVIEQMSKVGFDNVTTANNGFSIGDVVTDSATGSITVRAIEYNEDGLGGGILYGDSFTSFGDDLVLKITGGSSDVADSDTVTANSDFDAHLGTTQTSSTLAKPGTTTTNKSAIINFDTGTQNIPEQAIIEDATTGATGLVEQVYQTSGAAVGSIRVVDWDSANAWGDTNVLRLDQALGYNNQVVGQVFSVGDVVVGVTSGATGRVILDTGTTLVFADETGTWTTTEDLNVGGVKIADANGTNTTLNVAAVNGATRLEQRPSSLGGGVQQGGIYSATESLNIVRKSNSLYTYAQDTFDELAQMDDDEPIEADVKGGAYRLVFDWNIPDLGFRFLRKGAWADTNAQNVWANPQTQGVLNKITDTKYLIDSTQTFRQPQMYIEQNGAKVDPFWLEGQIDVILKTKTRTLTTIHDPVTPGLGQLIGGGDPSVGGNYTVLAREFHTSTYDATQVDGSAGGVNSVALGTADDTTNNPNGTHIIDWDTGSAATLLVGEEITTGTGNGIKIGQVVAQTGDAGATGTCEYVLKSGTQFLNNETLTGSVSGKTLDVNEPVSIGDVVAGYSADIAFPVVDLTATPSGGTGIAGTFRTGENLTQAVTGATGRLVYADTVNDQLDIEVTSGTFSGDNDITGDTSAATWDAGTGATYPSATTFLADLGEGSGFEAYTGNVGANIAGTGAETINNVYQYAKYLARHEEEAYIFNGPGTSDAGTVGNLYRRLTDTFAEIKPGEPVGTFAGVSMFLAPGWFVDSTQLASADIRSFRVTNNAGVNRTPPNLQALTITGLVTGDRVAAYRATGAAGGGSTTILRNEFDVGALGGGNNQAADTTILIGDGNGGGSRTVTPTPADVPDTGILYILDPNDTGNYLQFPYNAVNRTTNVFTLTSGDIQAVTGRVVLTSRLVITCMSRSFLRQRQAPRQQTHCNTLLTSRLSTKDGSRVSSRSGGPVTSRRQACLPVSSVSRIRSSTCRNDREIRHNGRLGFISQADRGRVTEHRAIQPGYARHAQQQYPAARDV